MTRIFGRLSRRPRRITQPMAIVRLPRDPAIRDLGFACFRLVSGVAVPLVDTRNTMRAFVR